MSKKTKIEIVATVRKVYEVEKETVENLERLKESFQEEPVGSVLGSDENMFLRWL